MKSRTGRISNTKLGDERDKRGPHQVKRSRAEIRLSNPRRGGNDLGGRKIVRGGGAAETKDLDGSPLLPETSWKGERIPEMSMWGGRMQEDFSI